jgi:DNA replication protein DnaC
MLDDLGVERVRGRYDEDWAASQLDYLVDQRYNEMRPTWYTTNLSKPEFTDRYGSRLHSRLCGENPLYAVAAGHDLRMTR